jgi:hexose-6-phosphate dehydrogenase
MVQYQQVRKDNQYADLAAKIEDYYQASGATESGRLFYLSVSPDFYPQIAKNINTLARPKTESTWMRVIFEKPFGRDFDSASVLAQSLNVELQEEEIYRVDHYIGKRAVRDIGTFRALNKDMYDKYWNKDHVESVEVVMKEKEDVEGRTWFYDNYGAVRDILQNHLTEVLAFAIADLPEDPEKPINRATLLKDIAEPDVTDGTFLQYEKYVSHVQQDRKDDSATSVMPTAVSVTLSMKSNRWAGVPIIMAHGKALDERVAFVRIKFKETALPGCEILFHIQGGNLGEFTQTCDALPKPILPAGWAFVQQDGNDISTMAKPTNKAPG